MFCTKCGNALSDDHRFCSNCGQSREGVVADPSASEPVSADVDWRNSTDYRIILGHPEVRGFIEGAAARKQSGMTGEEFLKKVQPLVNAAGGSGVPVGVIAELAQPLYAKLGVKTGKVVTQGYASPLGTTLAATLCSLALHNQSLVSADQAENGCILTVELPSSITAFKGSMTLTLEKVSEGTQMTGAVVIPGQAYDWGKSNKVLKQLHADILNFRSLNA